MHPREPWDCQNSPSRRNPSAKTGARGSVRARVVRINEANARVNHTPLGRMSELAGTLGSTIAAEVMAYDAKQKIPKPKMKPKTPKYRPVTSKTRH
eukprot:1317811-Amorphochlora_amoeboformis.AAC.1